MYRLVLSRTLCRAFCSNKPQKTSQNASQQQIKAQFKQLLQATTQSSLWEQKNQVLKNQVSQQYQDENRTSLQQNENTWNSVGDSLQFPQSLKNLQQNSRLQEHLMVLNNLHSNLQMQLGSSQNPIPLVQIQSAERFHPYKYKFLANSFLVGWSIYFVYSGSYSYGAILGTVALIPLVNALIRYRYPTITSASQTIQYAYLMADGKLVVKSSDTQQRVLDRNQLKLETSKDQNQRNYYLTIGNKNYQIPEGQSINVSKIRQLLG